MKNKNTILKTVLPIMVAILCLSVSSCEKDSFVKEGDYLFSQDVLMQLDNINGILIHWKDFGYESQKEVLRELVSEMVFVEGGTFQMGAQNSDSIGLNYDVNAQANEAPVHTVNLSDFHICKFELTQKQFYNLMGYKLNWSARYGKGDNMPAYNISYQTALEVVKKLNTLSHLRFSLPTEAQWEYAARGGQNADHTIYSGSNDADAVAWTQQNAGAVVHDVGSKQPNGLKLFDMSGNVWEWCADNFYNYVNNEFENPLYQDATHYYMLRGGSYNYVPARCRVAARDTYPYNQNSFANGMRLVLVSSNL